MKKVSVIAYRVMSDAELAMACNGHWDDSILVHGDMDEEGKKWLWTTENAARKWLKKIAAEGEESIVVSVALRKDLAAYDIYEHAPEGKAIHVPFADLGKAIKLKG